MNTDNPTLADIDRVHDDDPAHAAEGLRRLVEAGVPPADLARCAWLINHVVGETLGRWGEALALQRRLGADAPTGVLRHRAVAARLAGEPAEEVAATATLAQRGGATPAQAAMTVALSAWQFSQSAQPVQELVATILELLPSLQPGPLAALNASALSNLVSALLDRTAAPVDTSTRRALVEGAQACRKLWREAGNWLNHERADYLVALCANRVGDWAAALEAAQSGLDTIARHGSEEVDRAFLLLQRARACRGLGDDAGHAESRREALTLAGSFDEPGLREWFDREAAEPGIN